MVTAPAAHEPVRKTKDPEALRTECQLLRGELIQFIEQLSTQIAASRADAPARPLPANTWKPPAQEAAGAASPDTRSPLERLKDMKQQIALRLKTPSNAESLG